LKHSKENKQSVHLFMWQNLQVEGNANYVEPTSKVNTRDEDSIKPHSFMQDFINDDNETPK
jgi:hypothetical protein